MKRDNSFEYGSQRRLGILDTEFNKNNKIVTKVTRDNGLKFKSIAAEQFSRKEIFVINDTLSKRLFINNHRSKRTWLALTSSNVG